MRSANIEITRNLFSKFTDIMYASEQELQVLHDYILMGNKPLLLSDDKSELYDTADYLRDIARECKVASPGELLDYFERQVKDISNLITPLFSANEDADPHHLIFIHSCRTAFKTDSIKVLLYGDSFAFSPTSSVIIDRLNDITKMQVYNDRTYQTFNLITHCLHRIVPATAKKTDHKSILPNADYSRFANYYNAFMPRRSAVSCFIYLVKVIKTWISLLFLRKGPFGHANLPKTVRQLKKTTQLHQHISRCLRDKTGLQNDVMKSLLSRMMLLAKLNNPEFRKLHGNIDLSSFRCARDYYRYLADKKWSILESPAGNGWITTDNPGFSIDMDALGDANRYPIPDPYWLNMGVHDIIYFPLDRNYCLRLEPSDATDIKGRPTDKNSVIAIQLSSIKEIETVNQLTISTGPYAVLSEKDGIQLQRR
jgi:hypothetical protein